MASEAMQMSLTVKIGQHRQIGGLHVAVGISRDQHREGVGLHEPRNGICVLTGEGARDVYGFLSFRGTGDWTQL